MPELSKIVRSMDFAFPDLSKAAESSRVAAVDEPAPAPTPRIPLGLLATVTHAGPPRSTEVSSSASSSSKVTSEKSGKSQVDFMRLLSSEEGEAGTSQPLRKDIPLSELQQHNTAGDAWICIKGKIYDMSTYMTVGFKAGGQLRHVRPHKGGYKGRGRASG